MKYITHDLNHDLTFYAHTINCVCHSIRSMFRVLGIYNFGFSIKCFTDIFSCSSYTRNTVIFVILVVLIFGQTFSTSGHFFPISFINIREKLENDYAPLPKVFLQFPLESFASPAGH